MKKLLILGLLAAFYCQGCKKDDDYYTPGSSKGSTIASIIQFDNPNTVDIPADLATVSMINVQLSPEALAANRVITLATTIGKFANGEKSSSVSADAYGKAQFTMTSGEIGIAVITATVKNYSVTTTLKYIPAMPDDMLLIADKYQLTTTESAAITATLFRNPGAGSVSDPVKVNFSISAGTGSSLIITEFAYTATGVATGTISNPFASTGTYTVTAAATNQKGESIKKAITIVIK